MVRGVNKFKEYFKDFTGQYTFIGEHRIQAMTNMMKCMHMLKKHQVNSQLLLAELVACC